jgi:hypothetical protein
MRQGSRLLFSFGLQIQSWTMLAAPDTFVLNLNPAAVSIAIPYHIAAHITQLSSFSQP